MCTCSLSGNGRSKEIISGHRWLSGNQAPYMRATVYTTVYMYPPLRVLIDVGAITNITAVTNYQVRVVRETFGARLR